MLTGRQLRIYTVVFNVFYCTWIFQKIDVCMFAMNQTENKPKEKTKKENW